MRNTVSWNILALETAKAKFGKGSLPTSLLILFCSPLLFNFFFCHICMDFFMLLNRHIVHNKCICIIVMIGMIIIIIFVNIMNIIVITITSPLRSAITTNNLHSEGSRPEWCISSMIYSRDVPFWSGTLNFFFLFSFSLAVVTCLPTWAVMNVVWLTEAKKNGAKLQPHYHPGVYVKAVGKYSCCDSITKGSKGCEPVTVDLSSKIHCVLSVFFNI